MLDRNESTRSNRPDPRLDFGSIQPAEPRLQPWCDPLGIASQRSRFGGFERQIEAEVLHAMNRGLL
jgi:hypothetical protein